MAVFDVEAQIAVAFDATGVGLFYVVHDDLRPGRGVASAGGPAKYANGDVTFS